MKPLETDRSRDPGLAGTDVNYGLPVFPYEGIYIGHFWRYQTLQHSWQSCANPDCVPKSDCVTGWQQWPSCHTGEDWS